MEPLTVSDWQAGAPACSRKEGSNLFGPKKPRLCEFAVSDAYARNRWPVLALADRHGVGVTGQPILGIAGGLGVGGRRSGVGDYGLRIEKLAPRLQTPRLSAVGCRLSTCRL